MALRVWGVVDVLRGFSAESKGLGKKVRRWGVWRSLGFGWPRRRGRRARGVAIVVDGENGSWIEDSSEGRGRVVSNVTLETWWVEGLMYPRGVDVVVVATGAKLCGSDRLPGTRPV